MLIDDLLKDDRGSPIITRIDYLYKIIDRVTLIKNSLRLKGGRNLRQIIHIYTDCCSVPSTHIFKHHIIQREIIKCKREIRKKTKTIEGKNILRNIKVLKF